MNQSACNQPPDVLDLLARVRLALHPTPTKRRRTPQEAASALIDEAIRRAWDRIKAAEAGRPGTLPRLAVYRADEGGAA